MCWSDSFSIFMCISCEFFLFRGFLCMENLNKKWYYLFFQVCFWSDCVAAWEGWWSCLPITCLKHIVCVLLFLPFCIDCLCTYWQCRNLDNNHLYLLYSLRLWKWSNDILEIKYSREFRIGVCWLKNWFLCRGFLSFTVPETHSCKWT